VGSDDEEGYTMTVVVLLSELEVLEGIIRTVVVEASVKTVEPEELVELDGATTTVVVLSYEELVGPVNPEKVGVTVDVEVLVLCCLRRRCFARRCCVRGIDTKSSYPFFAASMDSEIVRKAGSKARLGARPSNRSASRTNPW